MYVELTPPATQLEYPGSNLPLKSEVSINLVLRPAIYKLPAQPFVKFLAVMSHRDTHHTNIQRK